MNDDFVTASARSPGPLRSLGMPWVGQTVASLCWIGSVFAYGLSGVGDYLQLSAASAWFVANLFAALSSPHVEPRTK